MLKLFNGFAQRLAASLQQDAGLEPVPGDDQCLQLRRQDGELAYLQLTPFIAVPQAPTARFFFSDIQTVDQLIDAYERARSSLPFESDLAGAYDHVNGYADHFLVNLFVNARANLSDTQAAVIADWIKHLDVYVAVKAIESLLNSQADMALLLLGRERGWQIHFDHLAIRCGSSARQDAQRVVKLLCGEHGYVSSQAGNEDFYQFADGWNAFPLYKMLENGQVLRIFVDQSDAGHEKQIIQHWNHVYGYTAHHLAMRATQRVNGQRRAVSLDQVMSVLQEKGLDIMTPTGMYTHGLLEQVFTRPERNDNLPAAILDVMRSIDPELAMKVANGKLLELVSRREMPASLAMDYFALYGLQYDAANPLHSAPAYQYFLPAQAAHVINTSVQI